MAYLKGHPAHCRLVVLEMARVGMGAVDASAAEKGKLASTRKPRLEMKRANLMASSALWWLFW